MLWDFTGGQLDGSTLFGKSFIRDQRLALREPLDLSCFRLFSSFFPVYVIFLYCCNNCCHLQGCIKFPIPPPGGGNNIKLVGKKIKWGRREGEGGEGKTMFFPKGRQGLIFFRRGREKKEGESLISFPRGRKGKNGRGAGEKAWFFPATCIMPFLYYST